MNRIQEVVHKFRSGNTEKRESGDGGGGGRRGMEPPTTGGHMTAKMSDNPLRTISSVPLTEEGIGQTRWYVAPPMPGSGNYASAMPSSEQSELSALPLLTTSGLQQTMLAALGHSDPVPAGPNDAAFFQQPPSPEKKAVKARPKGTLEYKVAGSDTLEKIAARFDVTPSELKKLNRMLSRTIFENQVLYIPDPEFVPSDPPTPEPESPVQSPVHQPPKLDLPIVKMADKPPAHVPGHVMKIPSPPSSAPPVPSAPVVTLPRALSEDEARKLDEECYERFIKVSTSHIREGFIKVAGTLLVTPNAIMFDPDVLKEGERIDMMEAGGVVVYMDTIISATLYHDLSGVNSHSPQKEGSRLEEDKPQSDPDSSSHPPAPNSQTPSSSDLLDGGSSPSVTRDNTLTSQTTTGLSSGINSVLRASEGSVSSGESAVTTAVSQDGKAGALVGDASQRGLEDDRGGEITRPSQGSGPNVDPCKPADSVHQGDQFSSFTETPKEPQQAEEDPTRDTQLSDEVDVQALLAGGRRDSLSALAAGEGDKVGNIFYPTSPEEVAKAGEGDEKSDALVKECADKLVSEILESVSWSSGLNAAAAPHPDLETAHAEVNHGAGGKTAEDGALLTDGTSRAATDGKPSSGEPELSGTTSTQPSDNIATEKTTGHAGLLQGADSDRQTLGTVNATDSVDKPGSTEPDTPPQTTSAKRKPAPLTDLPTDAVDGSSVSESTKSRPESGTFSPLRSSVQHLSNLLDYTTGFFRPVHSEDRASGKTFDVPLVREKSTASATRSSQEGREKGDSGGETEQVGGSMFYVKSGGQTESHGSDAVTSSSSGEVSARLPTLYLHLMVDTVESDRRFCTWSPSEASPQARTQPHYWFSFPRHKADHLYAFFTQWQPDAFGEDEGKHQKQGFVDTSSGSQGEEDSRVSALFLDYFGTRNHSFKRDWEIVSREEAIRRGLLSMDCSNMPELTQESCILSEQHILQLSNSLPSRTIGYKWSLAYSTNLHGFSLKRLYREVARIDSPILLVLSDTENTVFGAFLSDPPKLSDHFFGTGMCQLWTFKDKFRYFKWTGENSFFIKGDENSMSVGAGQGVYGLWLDSDLYHGRSHQCTTFNNIVLSATEDFCISALEAWTFVSD